MAFSTQRAQTIAAFMVRIAPSEAPAVEVKQFNGEPIILWHAMPTSLFSITLMIRKQGPAIQATAYSKATDADAKDGDTITVATTVHTNDEIARKILVRGLEELRTFQTVAEQHEAGELAAAARDFANAIDEGLESWGAGRSANYTGPGGQPAGGAGHADQPMNQHQSPDQFDHPLVQLRRFKSRTTFWLVANVIFVALGVVVTVGAYQAVGVGERYLIWWGPIVFGIINAIRLARRASKLSRVEREVVEGLY